MSAQEVSNCRGCTRPDEAEDMVACDECSQWWHYGCAGVAASVCNRSWRCVTCVKHSSYGSALPSGSINTAGTSARLRLQQLTEAKALEDRLRKEQADKEREYLQMKHQLEAELEAEERSASSYASSGGSGYGHRRREDIRKWIVQQQNIQAPDVKHAVVASTPIDRMHAANVTKMINPTIPQANELLSDLTAASLRLDPTKAVQIRGDDDNQHIPPTVAEHQGYPWQYTLLENMQRLPTQTEPPSVALSKHAVYQNVSTCSPCVPELSTTVLSQPAFVPVGGNEHQSSAVPSRNPFIDYGSPNQAPSGPNPYATQRLGDRTTGLISAQQLAARHVVSRDLPQFSGNPLEWPMFVKAFESTTEMCGIQPDENLARLQKSLVGSAREKVQSILTLPEAIPDIIATLRDECGRPDQLVHCLLTKVRNAPAPNVKKLDTLVTFGREVKNLVTYIEIAKLQDHLSNPMLLSELVAKLPPSLRLDWGLHLQRIPAATLKAFSDYVSTIKTAACQVSVPTEAAPPDASKRANKKDKTGFVNAHSTDSEHKDDSRFPSSNEPKPCRFCQQDGHNIRDCSTFKGIPLGDRWKFVDEHHLCLRCLNGHGKRPCRTKQSCDLGGCKEMHHRLLHPGKPSTSEPVSAESSTTGTVTAHRHLRSTTMFRILPVTLEANGRCITVFAFLDDGSELTLLETEIADMLGLDGENSSLCLQWTSNVTRNEQSSRRVKLNVSRLNSQSKFAPTDVRTVDKLGLPQQDMDYNELVKRFPYLRGLPVESYCAANPQILIGLDNVKLTIPLCKREGQIGEPVATKTRLGWAIFSGRANENGPNRLNVHACECSPSQDLHEMVKNYFNVETVGITGSNLPESPEDQRARRLLKDTTNRTDSGKFEVGLLWKHDEINFPDSYPMALQRFKCLQKQLAKNPDLKRKVDDQLTEFLSRGYAHKVTEEELQTFDRRRMWFLPLGIVRNPRKPNKIRIVWDAAAQVGNISLNSELLKGPDLMVSLLGVVFRFRQRLYALAGDIRQMFLQLEMRPVDRQSQLFLYSGESGDPEIYMLDVATFGATCSPCSAQYTKNVNALEHTVEFPVAAEAIVENTYVDDFLDSRDTVDELLSLAVQVRTINGNAGFEIRNWQSNAVEVLEQLGDSSTESTKSFTAEKSTAAERVLGITWNPTEDVLSFCVVLREDLNPLLSGEIVPTKRQVLRVLMSFFDPLGLITFYTVHGKILIQDIWRSGIKWDEKITDSDFANWQRWIVLTPKLTALRIDRCYFTDRSVESYDNTQLHVFVDASELAYCAVAYFRIVDQGTPRCVLVAAKSKVAPLKPQSIPRNELNAAVLGVRLMRIIVENHTIPITKHFFWTDSSTVLSWLRSDPRRYRQYVALRVSEVLEESEVQEWKKVKSGVNVADKGTKWGSGPCFDPASVWFTAPKFLYCPEPEWNDAEPQLPPTSEELRSVHVHLDVNDHTAISFTDFSSWDELIRKVAYLYHFVNQCQKDFEQAETSVWRMVQLQEFPEELKCLRNDSATSKKLMKRSSALAKISPYIDENGLLRMESRIDPKAAFYAYDFRNPIVIPRDNHVTSLLILQFHQRYGHANKETVLNELRQRYYIPKMRSVIGKVIRSCAWCRVYRATPRAPRMAALPESRVQPYVRPFTFTGVDYFGPLVIKKGRSEVKRWVALFTCLYIRAVHLEVVHSLTTESCKMAIRRFVARRGAPQQIYSDNGTNFKGAARDLAEEIKAINRNVAGTFTNRDTEWIFNPPSAPHMGGVWERQVRSVKEAFKALSHKDRLDNENLTTLLTEVEMIVNSRPLTFIPLESPEHTVITPNNFLLMSSDGRNTSSRIPVDEKISFRTNWKLMQHLLNQFWQRWVQAYLPTIARRTKWFGDVRPLRVGDLVVIVDEQVRNGWLRGKVIRTYPAKDGRVRKVDVQTDTGIIQRPAIKVALLDILEDCKAE